MVDSLPEIPKPRKGRSPRVGRPSGREDSKGSARTYGRAPHPYERFASRIPILPYWILLPALGLGVFIFGEAALTALDDRDFRTTQAIFAIGIGVGPALLIFLSHWFDSTLRGDGTDSLASVLWHPCDGHAQTHKEAFENWLSRWQRHTFGLKTRRARLIVCCVEAAGIATLAWSGLPFQSPIANAGCVVQYALLLWFSGQAAFTMVQLLRLLTALGSRQVHVPFSRLPHPAFSALSRYYSWLALLNVLGYGALAVALWQGPYGLSVPMLVWLTVLAVLPVTMTTWSFVQIHTLLRRAKQHHLDEANALVVTAMNTAGTGRAADLEAVQNALAIQTHVQGLSEWPFGLSSTVAFAASLVPAVTQIAVALAMWNRR